MHYGSFFLHSYFGNDVMGVINKFLQDNPTETVFMRLKNEYTPVNNTRSFADTFNSYMATYGSTVYKGTDQNPRLSSIRGKVVIMDNFPGTSVTPIICI
ncbi:MAG: hypothetical protein HRT35_06665 [Algicola sp.]|nr:hypothetical protein [Algicola sp.]